MGFQESMRISGSALSAQRLRMNTISNNLANAQTTRTDRGTPFRRQQVVFQPMFQSTLLERLRMATPHNRHLPSDLPSSEGGVTVSGISEDPREGNRVFEPGHPHADQDGYVEYPNVNVIAEMSDMINASRSYEANVTSLQSIKAMALKALEIGRA
ncbi:MAG: flagellar basal body rod protein FlgC [Candidatus Melainabacteria bacterium HGW-Melainabacteria-1]|nr:MAG: flagellar basal body rod protein FlgC [Candidatus Melainabacteria bacterium HGW-Melainabacteria-1]